MTLYRRSVLHENVGKFYVISEVIDLIGPKYLLKRSYFPYWRSTEL